MSPHGLFSVKINEYVGKDILNHDTLTTTGGSINLQTGKNPIGGIGINQEKRDKEGISRNTVLGDIEIGTATGSPINRDRSKANEITKDTQSSTNIYVESQTIDYITNPSRFKEDLDKTKQEIKDIGTAIKESINDRGDDNRNFLGQLSEMRLNETINNIAGERLQKAETQNEITDIMVATYRDLGYEMEVIYTTPDRAPQLYDEKGKPQAGKGGYVDKETGRYVILINIEAEGNQNKAGLIGTLAEEGSHIIGKLEGRQRETGTEEKGLESTGRATNEYFQDKYSKENKDINLTSDGKDYSNADFGEDVGSGRKVAKFKKMEKEYDNSQKELQYLIKNKQSIEEIKKELFRLSMYGGSSFGSSYEGIYVIDDETLRNKLLKNGELILDEFDPEGVKRVYDNPLYIKEKNVLIKRAEETYDKINDLTNVDNQGRIILGKDKKGAPKTTVASNVFKLEGSQNIFNADSIEYALGKTSIVGSIIIKKTITDNKIILTPWLRYQISDEFKNPIGIQGAPEWGEAYKLRTKVKEIPMKSHMKIFNTQKEYDEFIRNKNRR